MIPFETIGDSAIVTAMVGESTTAPGSGAKLILAGVSSTEEAAKLLHSLLPEQRRRTILVGLTAGLHILPPPNSFSGMLETYQVAGAVQRPAPDEPFGFVGPTDLAEPMNLAYLKAFQSPSYARWHALDRYPDLASFLTRYADVLEEQIAREADQAD